MNPTLTDITEAAPVHESGPIILLTGAGGTGKTTLATALAERYEIPFLKSSSREVQAQFGITREDQQADMSPEELDELQQAISDRYWYDACEVAALGKGYVADRTLSCHFTYRSMKSGFARMKPSELAWYRTRVREQYWLNNALVVYCPTGLFEPPDDGMRTVDKVQRELFDTFVRGVVESHRHEINLLPLFVAEHEARMKHIHSALLNCGIIAPADADDERLIRR